MIEIQNDNDTITLKFSKKDISESFYKNLIDRIQFEWLVNKAEFKEEFIDELSKEVKRDWWENNKGWIYEKIGKSSEGNN